MGDAGEGLIDNEARIQERMEELRLQRTVTVTKAVRDPERARTIESLRLARTELERQMATAPERRREQLKQAIEEVDRRMAAIGALVDS